MVNEHVDSCLSDSTDIKNLQQVNSDNVQRRSVNSFQVIDCINKQSDISANVQTLNNSVLSDIGVWCVKKTAFS